MNIDSLTTFDREILLRFFLHKMDMPTRRALITSFPVIYRKMMTDRELTGQFLADLRDLVVGEGSTLKPEDLKGLPFRECACGQEFTTDEQFAECEKVERLRDEEA